ncbi:MAG: diacylglycerol/polyprenol kinase family protein [Candidatus Methylomirabilales bacterium]
MKLPSFEFARKLVHLTGALVPLVYVFLNLTKQQALLVLGIFTLPFVGADILRLWRPAVNRWFLRWFHVAMRPGEENRVTGATYYLLACWLTILLFERTVAAAALLILACGDTAASIVGQAIGGYRLRQGKTLSGTLAFLIAAFVVSLPFFPPTIALGAAFVGAVTEFLPIPLDDNMTVPLAAGISLTLFHALPA